MRFKILVFDWDGTLMDSAARIVACMQAAVGDVGEPLPSESAIRDIIGLGLQEAVQALLPGLSPSRCEQIVQRYRHHFLVENQTPSELFTGVRSVIEELASAGYLLAIATGKGRHGLDRVLEATGLRGFFHATRCADETRSKPHPEMLLQLMDELGGAPEETLMIGDTEYDMQMARNAGAWSLGVSYGVHPCGRLHKHWPLGCLDSPAQIPSWLAAYSQARTAS